ncbi:dTDP-glucose 4,6-dehydratase [Streptomyces noursei]|uniref:dTDP-glucose 4,6-dehydratase n=1 Tax=Streptomyces noursei TaxID=1971 RepID=UPI00081D0D18|nr:dTDP-glucose 4,6-dehydratase [Streptomyces noursei ATCC 11455]MCZ0992652.1 dTDP-glucose 4,6-dehydratase [Streptomyces noursei]
MLVTGGAGFIGANFVRSTLQHRPEYEIAVIDALIDPHFTRNLDDVKDSIAFRQGDVCDTAFVSALVEELGIEVIVHFAAESHNDNAYLFPSRFAHTNVMGTVSLLEVVRSTGVRLHHVSTDEVYGQLALDDTEAFTPDTPYRPRNYYSASKAGADHFVRAAWTQFQLPVTISHCSNNYGPYQHVEKFIPRTITELLVGGRPRLHGSGRHVREWIHVDDHCTAIHAILDRGRLGETYVVGSDDERDNRSIVELILELMGKPSDWVDYVPDRPSNDLRYASDASKLRTECEWMPLRTEFRKEMAGLIDWYRHNESWWWEMKTAVERRYGELGR